MKNDTHPTKRIYLAPDDHTDYFWTANDTTYRREFVDTVNYYIRRTDETATNPAALQSRWNCDAAIWMWDYERAADGSAPGERQYPFSVFMDKIKSGHLSVPLNALVSNYGATPTEAVLRGMYYAGRIERREGVRFPLAVSMENQTQPLGLASLWAGSGAKYSWKGVCACATRVKSSGDREHEIYWYQGLDGARVLMKWHSLAFLPLSGTDRNQSVGGYAEARYPLETVPFVDTDAGFQSRYPFPVVGLFGQGWDDLYTRNDIILDAATVLTTPDRAVIVSNETDFFGDFLSSGYGVNLPTETQTFGNEWDIECMGLAEQVARVRRATEKLRGAEAMATLVTLSDGQFEAAASGTSRSATERDQAFMNIGLFWEHNFGMVGASVATDERVAWQCSLADQIDSYVNALHDDARDALGARISAASGSNRVYVFNPLGTTRTNVADYLYSGEASVHVVEAGSETVVPSQIVSVNGETYLRILARDLPPVGYTVYEIRPGASPTPFPDAATVTQNSDGTATIENAAVRVTLNRAGTVTSLMDKTRGNVERIAGRGANDFGGDPATISPITVEDAGAVSVTLVATSPEPLPHTTRLTLYANSDRVDVLNTITGEWGDTDRFWIHEFAVASPVTRHEEIGAILTAKPVSEGGHYSDRAINSRFDYSSVGHFADITSADDTGGVTVASHDLPLARIGESSGGTLDTTTPRLTFLAGGRVVDPAGGGIPNQGGDTQFTQRFSFRTHGAYSAADAMRFSLEAQNPPITGAVTGTAIGAQSYPADRFSLVEIGGDVLLWALKPAEEGIAQGVIARVWNVSDTPTTVTLKLNGARSIVSAERTTHIETPEEAVPISAKTGQLTAPLAAQQLRTFRLRPAEATPTS